MYTPDSAHFLLSSENQENLTQIQLTFEKIQKLKTSRAPPIHPPPSTHTHLPPTIDVIEHKKSNEKEEWEVGNETAGQEHDEVISLAAIVLPNACIQKSQGYIVESGQRQGSEGVIPQQKCDICFDKENLTKEIYAGSHKRCNCQAIVFDIKDGTVRPFYCVKERWNCQDILFDMKCADSRRFVYCFVQRSVLFFVCLFFQLQPVIPYLHNLKKNRGPHLLMFFWF